MEEGRKETQRAKREAESAGGERREAEARAAEMRGRLTQLQQELDNSVAVQTDFVRLSQSLQVELEKIRQSEQEVKVLSKNFSLFLTTHFFLSGSLAARGRRRRVPGL